MSTPSPDRATGGPYTGPPSRLAGENGECVMIPVPPPPHGTRARYLVHVTRGESPCRSCLRAEVNDLHMVMSVNIANEQAARDRMAMLLRWMG